MISATEANHGQHATLFCTQKPSQGWHTSFAPEGQITCLELGSLWPPNGRQLGQLHNHLPLYGIYRCQRSCATRAAALPHRLRQWKYRTRLIDGIYHLYYFSFLTSLYSSGFYSFILVIISMYLFGFEKLDKYSPFLITRLALRYSHIFLFFASMMAITANILPVALEYMIRVCQCSQASSPSVFSLGRDGRPGPIGFLEPVSL